MERCPDCDQKVERLVRLGAGPGAGRCCEFCARLTTAEYEDRELAKEIAEGDE
jgi:hypothetical protein